MDCPDCGTTDYYIGVMGGSCANKTCPDLPQGLADLSGFIVKHALISRSEIGNAGSLVPVDGMKSWITYLGVSLDHHTVREAIVIECLSAKTPSTEDILRFAVSRLDFMRKYENTYGKHSPFRSHVNETYLLSLGDKSHYGQRCLDTTCMYNEDFKGFLVTDLKELQELLA